MLRTSLYIPEQLNRKIEEAIKLEGKPRMEVIKTAIENGLNSKKIKGLKLAKIPKVALEN